MKKLALPQSKESISARLKEASSLRLLNSTLAPSKEGSSNPAPNFPPSARLKETPPSLRATQLMEWSDTLSVGVQAIDDQHKQLVAMLNEINEGIRGGWGKEARDEVLIKLVDYTLTHFATEESLMQIFGYPEENTHKKCHADLIQMVEQYIRKYNQDPNASSYDLLFFLKRWLFQHILKDDKALGQFLAKKGVSKIEHEKHKKNSFFSRIRQWFA
ncbi:MAG: bacteriohemerythrin [Candidatus Contendobacter sp.]|nr:bacteriohemerythrin [Candidatus Contendobacter sp.]